MKATGTQGEIHAALSEKDYLPHSKYCFYELFLLAWRCLQKKQFTYKWKSFCKCEIYTLILSSWGKKKTFSVSAGSW